MRRPVIIGASAATIAASWITTLALAASILNPIVTRQPNNDLQINWGKSSKPDAALYNVEQCPYVSASDAKCAPVADVFASPQFDEYQAVIPSTDVLTNTNAVVKIIVRDVNNAELERTNVRIDSAGGNTIAPPTNEMVPLSPGCQQNITTGAFPAELVKAVADAGGNATVFKPGTVYEVVVKVIGVRKDDSRLVDLRDFETECHTHLAAIHR